MNSWPRGGGPACLALGLLLCICGTAPVLSAPLEEAAPLDLPTVLRLAGHSSHAAASATTDLTAAVAGVDRARSGWWPQVDLSAQYTLRDNPIEAQAGALSFPTAEKNSGQYALQARELVWDGGRRGLAVTLATRQAEAVRLGGVAAVQQAQLEAVDAYLGLLELAGSGRVLEQRLQTLEAHLQTVEDLFAQGVTTRNDVLETQVRVRAVRDQIQAVADRRAVAGQDLNRRLGREPDQLLAVPDSLPAAPLLAAEQADLLQEALAANAGLQAASARQTLDETHLELLRRAWLPSFFVGVQHAFVENRYLVHQSLNSLVAGVTWNAFDGGARSAEVRQAEARTLATDRDRLEVRRALAVAVDNAWRGWQQARRELETARADIESCRENLRIVADQYRQGLARSSDVLDAETLLAQSRFDLVRRHYATYRTQAALLTAAGRDLTAFYSGAAGAVRKD